MRRMLPAVLVLALAACDGASVDSGDSDEPPDTDTDTDTDSDTGPTACNDGVDSDGDGLTDWQLDPGCWGPQDDDEEAGPRESENGCICYTVRAELVLALKRLREEMSQFDAVLIVTTGLRG